MPLEDDSIKLHLQETDDGLKFHLQEAEDIKKQWFSYVFDNIQKLNDKIEINTLQLQKEKEELLKLLVEYRDKLLEAIKESDIEKRQDLEKLREYTEKTIDIITVKLVGLTTKHFELRHLIETELAQLRHEFKNNIDSALQTHIENDDIRFDLVETDIGKIKNIQTILKTKVGVYVVILSLLITAAVTTLSGGLIMLFKEAIKSYLGL